MGDQVRELLNWARQRKILAAAFVGFTLVVGILIGSVVSGRVSATKGFGFTGTTLTVPDPIPATNSFAGIVNKVEPAVVNIATTQVLERRQARKRRAQPYDQDDPMQDFFDRFFDGRPDSPPPADRSLGSGVIVDKRGYILTNNHVIEQATKIQVQLNGETARYTAKLVGADEDTDLAVIKIDANKELPTAKLGNSDGVQVGDWVLAIGSPFGLQATVTAGIISAKDRSGIGQQFQRFLQTDAAINPGNSGGPLVDLSGQVIVITSVNGHAVKTGNDLVNPIAEAPIGSKVKLTYMRDRAQKDATATVEDRTRVFPNTAGRMSDQPGEAVPTEFGLHVEELTPERGHRVGIEGQKGVIVSEVEPASFAEDLLFTRGDVITEINRQPINSVADYRAAVSKLKPGDDVVFKVLRRQDGDRMLTVYLSGKVPSDNQQ